MTEPAAPADHEDPETLEDAEEAGPDASHGPGHHAAAAVDTGHDDHPAPPPENPRWVLVPLLVGLVVGVVVLVILGFGSGAPT